MCICHRCSTVSLFADVLLQNTVFRVFCLFFENSLKMDKIDKKSQQPRISIKLGDFDSSQLLIALLVLILTCVILFIWKKRKTSRTDFLLTGLCDSGKTFLFSQLIYSQARETFTSIAENVGYYQCGRDSVRVIDIPGHERLRAKFFDKYKNSAKGLVFVVDSATLQKDVRDAADYLYTILADNSTASLPILILCNKQDETMAKGSNVIKTLLEKELNLIRNTRTSQLESVGDSDGSAVFLGKQGKDFEFSQLTQNVQILECSALKKELNNLSDWIDRVV